MSAGGTGGVGGRREKTTALADECDSRCGAGAATLTDEELEGGTGGTGSLSAHTGGPISSHSRASLCTRFAICLAQKSPPRRSRNPSRRRVLGSAGSSRHTANRHGGRSACFTESRRSKGGSLWISVEPAPSPIRGSRWADQPSTGSPLGGITTCSTRRTGVGFGPGDRCAARQLA
jgi:hypothetical protein